MPAIALTPAQREAWVKLIGKGITHSIAGLSEMVGREVRALSPIDPVRVTPAQAPDLLGGAETVGIAVYLRITGAASGHMMLFFRPDTARDLIGLLLGQPVAQIEEMSELERSTLGEMDNIMGAFFLSAVADSTGLELSPTPPTVMMDMAGSLLDVALAEVLMETDELILADTVFGTADRQINGTFLVLPSLDLIRVLVKEGGNA